MLPDAYYREIDALTELRDASVGRLQCAQVLDHEAFRRYRDAVIKFVAHSKVHSEIPKRALQLINSSASFCLTAAEYSDDQAFVGEFGKFMDRAFFCAVGGEDLDDRQPGNPRVI
jgi:hypothetical protein